MPYIGKSPVGGGFHKLDALTASATATYALTLGSAAYFPETANQLLVSLNGVIQAPQDSFTVSGSNLIFDTALTASDSIDFVVALGDVLGVGSVTDGAVTANKIGTDAVTTAKIQDGAVTAAKLANTYQSSVSVALISDEKAHNADGGNSSAGWNDRDLNTESFDPDNIVSISSNQFTLGAGTYIIEFSCPSYFSEQNKAQLYDVTNSTAIANGMSVYAFSTNSAHSVSSGCGRVSITGNTTYKLRHYILNAKNSNGLGVALSVSSTGNNVYSQVKITKLA